MRNVHLGDLSQKAPRNQSGCRCIGGEVSALPGDAWGLWSWRLGLSRRPFCPTFSTDLLPAKPWSIRNGTVRPTQTKAFAPDLRSMTWHYWQSPARLVQLPSRGSYWISDHISFKGYYDILATRCIHHLCPRIWFIDDQAAAQRRWLAPPYNGRQLHLGIEVREDGRQRVEDLLQGAQDSDADAETGGPLRQHDGRGEDVLLDFEIFRSQTLSQPPNGHERSAGSAGRVLAVFQLASRWDSPVVEPQESSGEFH
ncbi:hypothetical protein FB107DRAFT_251793 [Schizophyllum commune]